jgi:uncharacterized OB-fold protein
VPDVPRPIPIADADSAPFWDGCRAHRLLAQRCAACGRWRWPPAAVCPHCREPGGAWTPLRGTGTISSFVVAHRASHPAFGDAVPYTIVFVTLDEAPADLLLLSNLVECPWERVRIGMRVEVTFEELPEGATLPLFRPKAA